MKKYFALAVLMLASCFASAQTTTFTTPTYINGCSSHSTPDGQNTTWTCWPLPSQFSDGTSADTGFAITLAQDGTFTGQFYDDGLTPYSYTFSGTYSGTEAKPTGVTGSFGIGSVTYVLGDVVRGGYKGTKIHVWSVTSGSGQLN